MQLCHDLQIVHVGLRTPKSIVENPHCDIGRAYSDSNPLVGRKELWIILQSLPHSQSQQIVGFETEVCKRGERLSACPAPNLYMT